MNLKNSSMSSAGSGNAVPKTSTQPSTGGEMNSRLEIRAGNRYINPTSAGTRPLDGAAGIKMNEIKSGNLKALPSMFQPLDEPGKQVMEGMIKDGQTWFLGLVAKRRGIDAQRADRRPLLYKRLLRSKQ